MLLSKIAPDRAKEYFCYDLKTGLVYIRCRKLPEVARKPLFDELVAKNPNVEMHGSHDIVCPASWLIDFLAKFYGGPIALHHQRVDPSSEEVCAAL